MFIETHYKGKRFPAVKRFAMPALGYPLPVAGNKLHGMPKQHAKSAGKILAENLKALMSADPNLSTGPKVAKAAGVSRKTINNLSENRHDPHLSLIEAIAKAFRIEVAQLVSQGMDNNLLVICRAYGETDVSGKELLLETAEIARKRASKIRRTGTDE